MQFQFIITAHVFREAAFRVADYIEAQLEITDTMRAILVDWLVEVSWCWMERDTERHYDTVTR